MSAAKQEWNRNGNGTSFVEVASVSTLNQFTCFLLQFLFSTFPLLTNERSFVPRVFVEYLVLFLPAVLTVTVLHEIAIFIPLVLFIFSSILVLRNAKDLKYIPQMTLNFFEDDKVKEINYFYSNLMIDVCVSILAVDFNIYPRRFAKTVTYGWGLMDIGVGKFININAILCLESRRPIDSSQRWRRIRKTLVSCFPMLILGFQRLAVIKGIEYHEEVLEYGVHWNFFFTLAFTKLCSTVLCSVICRKDIIFVVGALIGISHQALLSFGMKDFIQNDDRNGIFAANKEGILSLPGYVSLYLMMVGISGYSFHAKRQQRDINKMSKNVALSYSSNLMAEAFFTSIFVGLLTMIFHILVENVSRREANLAYICWMISLTSFIAWVEFTLGGITEHLKSVGKLKNEKQHESVLYTAIAANPLLVFLVANVLTGIVNLTLDTSTASTTKAVSILLIYTFILSLTALVCYIKNIKLKAGTYITNMFTCK